MMSRVKALLLALCKAAAITLVLLVYYSFTVIAFLAVWVYAGLGLEFFLGGPSTFRLIVQIIIFALVMVGSYRAGKASEQTMARLVAYCKSKEQQGGTNASENKAKE